MCLSVSAYFINPSNDPQIWVRVCLLPRAVTARRRTVVSGYTAAEVKCRRILCNMVRGKLQCPLPLFDAQKMPDLQWGRQRKTVRCGGCVCSDDVNKAFRRLSVLLHPDKSDAPGSEDAFKILVAARTALLKMTNRWRRNEPLRGATFITGGIRRQYRQSHCPSSLVVYLLYNSYKHIHLHVYPCIKMKIKICH